MQLIDVKSNEPFSKCHDSPKITLPVQFSYYCFSFNSIPGQAFASAHSVPTPGNLPISLKKYANAWGLAWGRGEWALVELTDA